MWTVLEGISWAILYMALGGIIGGALVLICASMLPKLLDRMTPAIDEDKEIARGNQAVAEYFGRVVAAAVLGMSVIVAAAVLGGLLSAFHG